MATKQKYEYKLKPFSPIKDEDKEVIADYIFNGKKIPDRKPKKIREELLSNPDLPMYKYIEWDKDKCAERDQLNQIMKIINHYEVIEYVPVFEEERPVQFAYSVKDKENLEEGYPDTTYVTKDELEKDPRFMQQKIDEAEGDIKNWLSRYAHFKCFYEVAKDMKKTIEKIKKIGVGY